MVQKLFILKLEPDLDPKPEKLCEHGAWCLLVLCSLRMLKCAEYQCISIRSIQLDNTTINRAGNE